MIYQHYMYNIEKKHMIYQDYMYKYTYIYIYTYSDLYPIGSMYAIYGNIYHQYTPNVSIYTSTMDPTGIYSMGISGS